MSRNRALDGIRGLAALSVAGGHSILAVSGLTVWGLRAADFGSHTFAEILQRLGYLLFPSDAAVMLFFVLSGHVLWEGFSKKYARSLTELPDYVVSRTYRLLPTSIAVGLLYGLAEGRYIGEIAASDLIGTMFILTTKVNGVLWSLQIEVVCSIGLFLVWYIVRGSPLGLALCLVGSVLAYRFDENPYVLCSTAFFAGGLVRHAPLVPHRRGLALAAGLLVLVGSSLHFGHGWQSRYGEMIGAFVVVAYVRTMQPAALLSRPVQFLGDVSYPFYLVHPLALMLTTPLMAPFSAQPAVMQIVGYFTLSVGIALPVAWILHVAVEKPIMAGRPTIDARALRSALARMRRLPDPIPAPGRPDLAPSA